MIFDSSDVSPYWSVIKPSLHTFMGPRAFDSRWYHWNFSLTAFWSHYGPGVDSASNRNEYQDYFLGGEGSRCARLTNFPPSCADCLEIWESLNFVACRGPVQACNGTAVPLRTIIHVSRNLSTTRSSVYPYTFSYFVKFNMKNFL